jgi:hypothetical protein
MSQHEKTEAVRTNLAALAALAELANRPTQPSSLEEPNHDARG